MINELSTNDENRKSNNTISDRFGLILRNNFEK